MASSVTSATAPAATPAVNSSDLVNVAAGTPAQERWPSAVDPSQYTDAGPDYPIEGPAAGSWVLDDFTGSVPQLAAGGGIQDTSWTTGTDGPQAVWDSAGGAPVTPNLTTPGALPPELHGEDTGAVFQNQYSPPPAVGQIVRSSIPGQTWNREFAFDPVIGQYVPAANGRMNLDQQQRWDPAPGDGGGYAPWDPGYAERPVLLNVAYQSTPVTSEQSPYSVSGALPDKSPWNAYQAQAYTSPADPAVYQLAAPAASDSGGWLLG
jgi:hypothetical protein